MDVIHNHRLAARCMSVSNTVCGAYKWDTTRPPRGFFRLIRTICIVYRSEINPKRDLRRIIKEIRFILYYTPQIWSYKFYIQKTTLLRLILSGARVCAPKLYFVLSFFVNHCKCANFTHLCYHLNIFSSGKCPRFVHVTMICRKTVSIVSI